MKFTICYLLTLQILHTKFGRDWPSSFWADVNTWWLMPTHSNVLHELLRWPRKLESPLPKDALCQVCLKLAQWFWRRRWKCEKFTDGQQVIRKAHLWFQLRWGKNKQVHIKGIDIHLFFYLSLCVSFCHCWAQYSISLSLLSLSLSLSQFRSFHESISFLLVWLMVLMLMDFWLVISGKWTSVKKIVISF